MRKTVNEIVEDLKCQQYIPRTQVFHDSRTGTIDAVIYNITGNVAAGTGEPFTRFEATQLYPKGETQVFKYLVEAFAHIGVYAD